MVTAEANGVPVDEPGAAAAWAARAGELAGFFWPMVNRADVWGGYRPMAERGKEYTDSNGKVKKLGAPTTRPEKSLRGRVRLTIDHLVTHFRATVPEQIVGLHSTSPENTSRTGAVDIDWHGEGSSAPEINLAGGQAWHKKLIALELTPLLSGSNGRGGCHLELLLSAPLPTPLMYSFLRWLVSDHANYGLTTAPETFPKQPRVAAPGEKGEYGNWLRLPGMHHTNQYLSSVWNGAEFVSGEDAVEFILSLKPTSPMVVQRALDQILEPLINAYRARLPNLGEGQGRDDVAFNYACWLARDLWREDETVLRRLGEWDKSNTPPKGDDRLREILDNAHQYGQQEYGCGLEEPGGKRSKRRGRREKSAVPPQPARTFAVGSVALKPGVARRTQGGKLLVQVAVLKGDVQLDSFPLSDSLSGRKEAERLIRKYLTAADPAKAAIQNILGELLVYVANRLDSKPEEEGPLLRDLVFNRVQEQFKIRFRTDAGLWSETLGEVRRAEFITHCPEWLVIEAGKCRGMPRDINGDPVRHDIARAIEAELKILYATLRESLPMAADAPLTEGTEAGRKFKEQLFLIWTKICTAEHLNVPEGEEASRRASLIRRVQTAAEAFLKLMKPSRKVGWQRAHPSYSAWWRPWIDPVSGEVRVYLAMRWDLPAQVGVPLPGVRDGRTLTELGRMFNLFDPDPAVPPVTTNGEARLSVLNRDITDCLLSEPENPPEEDGTAEQESEASYGVT